MLTLLILTGLLTMHPARAEDCLAECRKLPVRMAELRCQLRCEQLNPEENRKWCPGFTPCLIACEEKLPQARELTQALKDEKTACNGVCFTNFFKLDCKEPNKKYPPGEDGSGYGARKLGAQGGEGGLALAADTGLAGARKTGGAGSAGNDGAGAHPRSEGVEAAIRHAEEATAKTLAAAQKPGVPSGIAAEIADAKRPAGAEEKAKPDEEHLWNLKGGLKAQAFEEKPGESAFADVVKASIGEAGELTLFQMVTRAYRGSRYWNGAR